MRTITREIVGALLFSKDGKILLGKTAKNAGGVYSGSWVIPGGGVDDGETKEQAVIREVLEETHFDITGLRLELIDDTATGKSEKTLKTTGERVLVKMNFHEFKIVLNKTAAELGKDPSDELVELEWFYPEALEVAELSKPTRELFEKVGIITKRSSTTN